MLNSLLKLTRPVQWLKNGILIAALIFAGEFTYQDKVITAFLAMLIFCLLSSAIYVFNDFLDCEKDKLHPIKKNRPLASGKVSKKSAVILTAVLLIASLYFALLININFFLVSVSFVLLNILYTLWLKQIVIVDVMSIALSFVIRAYAGALAINVPASKWLIINTLMLALFLGFGKRRHELVLLEKNATAHRKTLIKYSPYLLDQLIGVVTSAVVVIYLLYTFSSEVSIKLGTENLFLTIPFVIYGIFRYLFLIHREEMGGSPTKVLISDKPILITVVLWIVTIILILY